MDDTQLVPHHQEIEKDQLKRLIREAIQNANLKSSRTILNVSAGMDEAELQKLYRREGQKLFKYFKKYCGDPASTAHQLTGQHYRAVANELFRNRTLQMERMNSGWRYQFLATDCARVSGRFRSVSDIGASEADVNIIIDFADGHKSSLNLYVSIKNRSNTMGGQDWPKAIKALESVAINDKNRTGPYCCVFGIAMERGKRFIKRERITHNPHSVNTEVWLSDFFWPFFANLSYEEVMSNVLEVLRESDQTSNALTYVELPEELLEEFSRQCRLSKLIDEDGVFNDPYALVRYFCQ